MAIQTRESDAQSFGQIANQLNDEWEAFGVQFDSFAYTMDPTAKSSIQKAISDWQDWFYGNFDAWPDPSKWYYILEKAKAILAVELRKGIKEVTEAQRAEIEDKPISAAYEEPIELDPIYIYGKVPKFGVSNGADPFAPSLAVKEKKPFPWGWIVAGIAAVAYFGGQKKKKRK